MCLTHEGHVCRAGLRLPKRCQICITTDNNYSYEYTGKLPTICKTLGIDAQNSFECDLWTFCGYHCQDMLIFQISAMQEIKRILPWKIYEKI